MAHNNSQNIAVSSFKITSHQKKNLPKGDFEPYITKEKCSDGLKRGVLIKGVLRINPKKFTDAFISADYNERDILLEGVSSRNRALPGDVVAVELIPQCLTKVPHENNAENNTSEILVNETNNVKRGKVVFIIEKKHPRVATGYIMNYRSNKFGFAYMSPVDSRLPRVIIPLQQCPPLFLTRPQDFCKTLFVARIIEWEIDMGFAYGELMRSLGEAGNIEAETESIIAANAIDSSPFSEDIIACLPNGDTWSIKPEELKKRKDLREECIFTIDPATARDLDDAVSCKKISDDLFEVGVHIADVSFFIEEESKLDIAAKSRATSVYLSQKVIPMLPAVLCERLCSLNPGVERLAYSVIWNMRSDGTVLTEWFGRSVIRSCVKLSYTHAQQLIETGTDSDIKKEEFPIVEGFSLEKVRDVIHYLFKISQNLRKRRFDSGALRIDQPKLSFNLDSETGLPNGCSVYEYKDSNRLIEELMLLANMAVGRKIYAAHPDQAILRNHPAPHPIMLQEVQKICSAYSIFFDISDSSSISKSLTNLSQLESDSRIYIEAAVTMLCAKPFQNATYFCTGTIDDESLYYHYALNVPIYTHFTSPIRRYPDILVHRLLTAALDSTFKVKGRPKQLQAIAEHCNERKWTAKKASEQSSDVFFAIYVKECGPFEEKGVVVAVLDKSIDVLCIRLGVVKRVYCDKLLLSGHKYEYNILKPKLTLFWKKNEDLPNGNIDEKLENLKKQFEAKWALQEKLANSPIIMEIPDDAIKQELEMFSPVEVILSVDPKFPTRIDVVLKNPFLVYAPELNL
ncbi:DIS3-like exonuclease 2 [Hydra vulgaris]|uniref:DIS3-like exonuclease 2 n=1 Tax=Hydra vulgaris TaxID=6087 RepID=A0ABM4CVR5_HYDVU